MNAPAAAGTRRMVIEGKEHEDAPTYGVTLKVYDVDKIRDAVGEWFPIEDVVDPTGLPVHPGDGTVWVTAPLVAAVVEMLNGVGTQFGAGDVARIPCITYTGGWCPHPLAVDAIATLHGFTPDEYGDIWAAYRNDLDGNTVPWWLSDSRIRTYPRTIARTEHRFDTVFRSARTCVRYDGDVMITNGDGTPMRYGINKAWAEMNGNTAARLRDHGDGRYTVDADGYHYEFRTGE